MAYKITWVTTKPSPTTPDFYDWVCSLPDNFMDPYTTAAGPYVANAGQTPKQIIDSMLSNFKNPASGFLSLNISKNEDGTVITNETIYQDKESLDQAEQNSNLNTANKYLQDLYRSENNITINVTVSEI